jgi:YD repeat-containing protein
MKIDLRLMIFWLLLIFSFRMVDLRGMEDEVETHLPLADTDGVPSTLIDGCVSAITGDYIEFCKDLLLPGPEPLVFDRFYCSADYLTAALHRSWRHNHDTELKLETTVEGWLDGHYTDSSGRFGYYHGEKSKTGASLHWSTYYNKQATNIGFGKISAQTNVKNTKIEYFKESKSVEITTGDNTRRYFKKRKGGDCELKREKRPSGNQLIYGYDDEGRMVSVQYTPLRPSTQRIMPP